MELDLWLTDSLFDLAIIVANMTPSLVLYFEDLCFARLMFCEPYVWETMRNQTDWTFAT
jgi:hypothetical protein